MSHEVITFGCRLNAYESEVIKKAIESSPASQEGRETIVFNSCAVTKEAERQLRQAIRKTRREKPDAQIIVTGCAAQITPERYAAMKEVDKVLGNEEKMNPSSYAPVVHEEERVLVNDIMSVTDTASHLISGFDDKVRAFVQVQNGCNHRCTFCIIPYGRGNSRSVPIGEVVNQVRQLVENGYKEVVLTGVDISDYGKDLPGAPSLSQMMRRLLNLVPGLLRLRLSSIDVAEIDDELFHLITTEQRIMPHIHISVQAGDDMILKRMKRRHTRAQVIEFCDRVRAARPEVVFGADIIAGFPTETDEMFANTLNLVSEAGLTYLHVFPYSEREGTPAARMPQVPVPIRKDRAQQLREAGERAVQELMARKINTHDVAIIENDNTARCTDFSAVKLTTQHQPGEVIAIHITGLEGATLVGAHV